MATVQLPDEMIRVKADVVARALDVSERTVRRMVEAGKIPYYRAGEGLRFDLAEVLAALKVERSS